VNKVHVSKFDPTNQSLWRLVFYSHVENTYMTASFHQKGRFGTIKVA